MTLEKFSHTTPDGKTYEYTRGENSYGIEWRSVEGKMKYSYNLYEDKWYCHAFNTPAPLDDLHEGCSVWLEREFQNGKLAILADPQYRLVLRGQSFKTGEEVIELQVYNQPRGIYEKVPAKVTLEDGITLDDLKQKHKRDNLGGYSCGIDAT